MRVHIAPGPDGQWWLRNPSCNWLTWINVTSGRVAKNFRIPLKPSAGGAERHRVKHQVQHQVQPGGDPSARARRSRTRHARRRFFHGLRLAAALVVAAVSATVAISVFTLHLGIRPVLTGSMRPDYGPGALLLTREVPTSSLRPGMIVLLVPPGEHAAYAHRITSVSGTPNAPVITTKGDANKVADPWHARITASRVSEVVGSVPGVGRPLVLLRGPGQIILALAGGLLAAWAGARWLLAPSSRAPGRRAPAGGA
jgi:signal peptidase I